MAGMKGCLSELEKKMLDSISDGKVDEVKHLLNEPDVRVDCMDTHGMTPLQHAAYKGKKAVCELLLAHGANVNSHEHEYGYTALMFAALSGNTEVVKLMLDAGARTDYINSVGRNASQMAAFTGQHQCVSIINNYFSRDVLEYYTVPKGFETEPKLPSELVPSLHKLLLSGNLHPVHISLYLRDNKCLLENSEKVTKVLDLICEKNMKSKETNDIRAMKSHYMSFLVKQCHKFWQDKQENLSAWIKSLLRAREGDGTQEVMEQCVRQALKEFPYVESKLLQQIVPTLAKKKIGEQPDALMILTQALNGQQFGSDDTACDTCGETGAEKKCSACKKVVYCNQVCQKLHWFTHKKFCKQLAEQYQKEQGRLKQEQEAVLESMNTVKEAEKEIRELNVEEDKPGAGENLMPTTKEQ
ncbi:ankyrin repeat and MYND domain-containing protein 2 [Lingula anatina]|uniref:Ankyrin repeat and MYND domain-containing protein 2 n=1 Tax=Lingula anatina TaxID=7574 RepID=A0A1S3J933_LINAN|nr:ankyrin repeat and MYND domain-containing protein 2 [Lingula anatina]|eukprot:XP_013406731.1 ankyrin repeat and MYND domain-containing protein 2 [Lingula anatina]